jgi:DNA polymerase III epsilon subunit-like protein
MSKDETRWTGWRPFEVSKEPPRPRRSRELSGDATRASTRALSGALLSLLQGCEDPVSRRDEVSTRSWVDGPLLGVDLATSGVDGDVESDEIVSFALVSMEMGTITDTTAGLVRATRPIPSEATALHHITTEMAMNVSAPP